MRRLPVTLFVLACGGTAWAYGEDIQSDNRSTAHYDMTKVLARCAGFTAEDATAIAEANQAADSLTYGSTTINFAERTGPNSSTFHFPQAEGAVDIDGNGFLKTWALGMGTLAIPACDANGRCCDDDGVHCVESGSLQAIGLWLHAVGDYWSHHACLESGGMNHGMYDHDEDNPDNEQPYYCASTMHSHEWGRRDTDPRAMLLEDNAQQGLATVREQITALAASRGYTACGQVTDDDLLSFASTIGGDARSSITSELYSMCDATVTCGPPAPGAEGDIDPRETPGCGCESSDGSTWLVSFGMFGVLALRKRRR